MEALRTYDAYRDKVNLLRQKAAKENRKVITNCYFLPGKVKKLIADQKLYIEEQNGNLFICEQEPTFYRVYYYVQNPEAIEPLQLPLSAVIEFTYKDAATERGGENAIAVITKMGFKLGRQSGRMVLQAARIPRFFENTAADVLVEYAKHEDKQKIWELLHNAFIPIYAFLPQEEELDQLILDKSILALRYQGDLAGIWHTEIVGKNAWGRQLVVDERYRGKGYGRMLMCAYHDSVKDRVERVLFWVDMANPAISLYKKLGYEFDGCMANEYIRLREQMTENEIIDEKRLDRGKGSEILDRQTDRQTDSNFDWRNQCCFVYFTVYAFPAGAVSL